MDWRAIFSRLVQALRRRCGLNLFRIYVRPLGSAARIACACEGLQIRLLGEDEVVGYCAEAEMDLREPQVRAAFARGDRCIGAFAEGRLIAYTWLAYAATPHIRGVWADFSPQLRYSYKTFVHPRYRGKRVVQAMHAFCDDPALRRGKAFALNYVDIENFASFAALERAGSRVAGFAGYVQAFGALFSFRSPGAWRWGFRFYVPAGIHRLGEHKRAF